MEDTFTQYQLVIDPSTKLVSAPAYASSASFQEELRALNATHRSLVTGLEANQAVPPPPVPLNPKRSQLVQKLREQGNAALSKLPANANASVRTQAHTESLKYYNLAIQAALDRPAWEPAAIVREECGLLFSNRAQAHLGLRQWPEASVDAETAIEMKAAPGQGKAWWRKVKALMEMGRWDEAETWAERGLGIEPQGESAGELRAQLVEIRDVIRRREQARGLAT